MTLPPIQPCPEGRVTEPGFYRMTAEAYHADPCPSVSSSFIKTLLSESPLHAARQHPRIGEPVEQDDDKKFDVGTVAHSYMIGEGIEPAVIDAPDYRTKAAREERDQALDDGRQPILAHQYERVVAMVDAALDQIDRSDTPQAFREGAGEIVMIWREGNMWARAMCDWLCPDHLICDLKTSDMSSNPNGLDRRIDNQEWHIQREWYARGYHALTGKRPAFKFFALEAKPPHCLTICEIGPAAQDMGRREIERALSKIRWCMASGYWPAYPLRTVTVDLPAYAEARRLQREMEEADRAAHGESEWGDAHDFQQPLEGVGT